jgi:hypothetical protein
MEIMLSNNPSAARLTELKPEIRMAMQQYRLTLA